jgi:hypothetical protein
MIDDSLLIGVPRQSLHCVYTLVYLVISSVIIVVNITLMINAVIVLYFSIKSDKSENSRNYKKRIITMVLCRTLVPMSTFNLPAFFVVYVIEFDQDDTAAATIQWCILLMLFSPTICCLATTIGLRPYRRALFGLFQLNISRFIERRSGRHKWVVNSKNQRFRIRERANCRFAEKTCGAQQSSSSRYIQYFSVDQ